jgi:hypothetical protein
MKWWSKGAAEGTMAFRLSKPAGFRFKPGQAVDLALIDPPAEAVATRMRAGSAFKRALKALPLNAKIRLKGPLGIMTLHQDRSRAAVLIAGGIGITPFMSMLRQAAHDRLDQACSCFTRTAFQKTRRFWPSCKIWRGETLRRRCRSACLLTSRPAGDGGCDDRSPRPCRRQRRGPPQRRVLRLLARAAIAPRWSLG